MFMVTTDKGVRVDAGVGQQANGLTEEAAKSSARERNERARKLGLKVEYIIAPFEELKP